MRYDIMTPDEAREFSDRICEMRWERRDTRAARRQARTARCLAFMRSRQVSFALLQPRNSRH